MHATTFAVRARERGNPLQTACKEYSYQVSGVFASTCLPSRLSRVRASSPAPKCEPSLYWLTTGRFVASARREGQQAGGFMLFKKVYSDILPQFGVTSCLARRDILPWRGRDILPWQLRDILPCSLSPRACLQARHKP